MKPPYKLKHRPVICGVYLMISEITGAHYIGASKSFLTRAGGHLSLLRRGRHLYQRLFYTSFIKGKLSFFLLEKCELHDIEIVEQRWMDLFPDRVNKSRFVKTIGVRHSHKILEQIRQKLLGKKHSEKAKQAISESLRGNTRSLGYHHTSEAKEKIGKASSNRKRTAETKRKTSLSLKGHKVSNKTRQKISETLRNKK
jgi:group I intron endonuclease